MDITQKQYLFQSPYHSQVQFGREDQSVKQNESAQQQGQELVQSTNATANDAQLFASSQSSEVEPRVTTPSTSLLDTYA